MSNNVIVMNEGVSCAANRVMLVASESLITWHLSRDIRGFHMASLL